MQPVYWLRPFRVCVDLSDESYWRESRCPADAVAIDLLEIDPADCAETRLYEATRDYRPVAILHLSACDLITVVAALAGAGIFTSRSDRALRAGFASNPYEGFKAVCRAVFPKLPAHGEAAYYRAQAIASNPSEFAEFHQAQGN